MMVLFLDSIGFSLCTHSSINVYIFQMLCKQSAVALSMSPLKHIQFSAVALQDIILNRMQQRKTNLICSLLHLSIPEVSECIFQQITQRD